MKWEGKSELKLKLNKYSTSAKRQTGDLCRFLQQVCRNSFVSVSEASFDTRG